MEHDLDPPPVATYRFELAARDTFGDPRADRVLREARSFLNLPLERVKRRRVLKVRGALDGSALELIRSTLTDPVTESSALGALPAEPCDWTVAIGFKPGVTDNVGRTARLFIRDLLPPAASSELAVHTETLYLLWGSDLTSSQVDALARELLANPLIERIELGRGAQRLEGAPDVKLPLADDTGPIEVREVPLPADDDALLALSRERTLALSLDELRAIADHYADPAVEQKRRARGLPRVPTDIELEALAQTWSEHCKHKIFNASIAYTDEHGVERQLRSLFKTCIVAATRDIAQRVDWLVSVFDDNAGVVRLDHELDLVFKVETHNSPSALDPYGGSITGIVGVNRDPFGTGMGAELLTNVWGYCLGSPFHSAPLPEGLLHPRRIRDGVHRGVIDGGNQSGIPYSRGFELFDERFIGKPLVFCGTVGLLPREVGGRPAERKEVAAGDVIVMVGGRIGKDGIHGATFSSEALQRESPAQAVQIGDPITQKMMFDMLLEARDAGLYRAITDNGAGGLSSSVGEMAQLAGGAEIDLERAPLKYAGLQPWEIFLSEAQERMTLAVPPESLEALLELARRREVEATALGHFTNDGELRLRYEGRLVGALDMAFLHGGCPTLELTARWDSTPTAEESLRGRLSAESPTELLGLLVRSLDLCSKEEFCRRYDHEVKGLSVIKPLVGVHGDVFADATVMRVRPRDPRGILLSEGIAPRLSDLDPGAMTRWVVDLAVRRIVAAGGHLGAIAGLDNFCWPDPVLSAQTPDGPRKLAGLVRSCEALSEMTRGLDVPLISGKDSMKNDSVRGGVKISIPPTLLFSALGWLDDITAVRDLVPAPGQLVYLLGETKCELGGSQIVKLLSERDGEGWPAGEVPNPQAEETLRACKALEAAGKAKLLAAAHALHAGGLGMGLATLCLAGDVGLDVSLDLPGAEQLTLAEVLYSESGARFLVTVEPGQQDTFEKLMTEHALPVNALGAVTANKELRLRLRRAGELAVDAAVNELRKSYEEPLRGL